jgi:hypothetical protein
MGDIVQRKLSLTNNDMIIVSKPIAFYGISE